MIYYPCRITNVVHCPMGQSAVDALFAFNRAGVESDSGDFHESTLQL